MQLKGKRILVTGGAGFVGSHIVEGLVSMGAEVVVYDNFTTGKIDYLKNVEKEINIIKGDILDYKDLNEACKGIGYLSHQAAQLEIFKAIENPLDDLKTNTIGTLNVLNAAEENNIKKVINASSVSVYGQAVKLPQDEEHPTDPNWAYGVSKLAAEKYCQIYSDQYGIPIINLRYGQVYGVREWFGRVLTVFIKRMIDGESLVIFGDGMQVRDLVYVSDVVRCHNICLERDDLRKGVFNVGSGKGITINELAKSVQEVFDNYEGIIYEDPKEGDVSQYVRYRKRIPCELREMAMCIDKTRKILNWKPEVGIKEGIKKTADWVSANPSVWNVEGLVSI